MFITIEYVPLETEDKIFMKWVFKGNNKTNTLPIQDFAFPVGTFNQDAKGKSSDICGDVDVTYLVVCVLK